MCHLHIKIIVNLFGNVNSYACFICNCPEPPIVLHQYRPLVVKDDEEDDDGYDSISEFYGLKWSI